MSEVMWFHQKGERTPDDGAAIGSRAVLILAICFLILCLVQAAVSVVNAPQGQGLLDRAYNEASEP